MLLARGPQHRALQVIKRHKIGNLLRRGIFDHVAPDDLLLGILVLEHPVLELRLGEVLRHLHAREIPLQQIEDGVRVPGFHGTHTRDARLIGQFVAEALAGDGAADGEGAEADVVELLPVYEAVEVAARRHGRGQHGTDGVDGLEDAFDVAAARDLLDEEGCEAFGTQLLMDAEEVYFGGVEDAVADAELDGDGRDEGAEFAFAAAFGGADADVPFFLPPRGFEGPGDGVSSSSSVLVCKENTYQFKNEGE